MDCSRSQAGQQTEVTFLLTCSSSLYSDKWSTIIHGSLCESSQGKSKSDLWERGHNLSCSFSFSSLAFIAFLLPFLNFFTTRNDPEVHHCKLWKLTRSTLVPGLLPSVLDEVYLLLQVVELLSWLQLVDWTLIHFHA